MYLAGMPPEASNAIGYGVGLIASYLLNKSYTFKQHSTHRGEFTKFLAVFAIAYGLNFLALLVLVHGMEMHQGLSQVLAGLVYVSVSYLMNKFFVFKTVEPETQIKNGAIINRIKLSVQTMAKINSKSNLSNIEYVLIFAAIVGMFMLLFGPALLAKFYIIEDHLLVDGRLTGISDFVSRIVSDIQGFQRVRPAYWLYITLCGKLFGTNPHLWHAAAILWGVLTCYLFYIALRKIGADMASSFVFVLLLVLSGNQNWIWLNLIPQETIGMLFTAVAVWGIVFAAQRGVDSRWDILALAAMASAGLVKESFVILIPALLLLRWTCQKRSNDESWRETLRRIRLPLAIGVLIFMIEIALVMTVLLSNLTGYSAKASGLSVASFGFRRCLEIFSALSLNIKIVLAAGFVLWVSLWFDKKFNRTYLLVGAAILLAWIVPQVLLYSNGLSERYLFPAIVGIAAAVGLGLSILLRKQHLWPLWFVVVIFILPIIAKGVTSTTSTVGAFTAETVAANRMIEFLAQNVPSDQPILMAGDSGTPYGFEATYSLPIYLKMAGSRSSFYLWPIVSNGERSAMHIAASKNNTAFRYPDTLNPRDVGAIIVVDKWIPSFDSKLLVQWLGDTAWREVNFTKPYYSFSLCEFKYIKSGEINHKILLPHSSSSIPSDRPLIVVDHSLTGVVYVRPFLDPPPWGLEPDYEGSGSIVWIGQGDEEALGGILTSTREQMVVIDIEVVPGPSRPDYRRTVEFSLENSIGQQNQCQVFEDGQWKFYAKMLPGVNHFRIRVLDAVTVPVQPNGDTRNLLALVRRITIRE
jgi:putative flippase GtrA